MNMYSCIQRVHCCTHSVIYSGVNMFIGVCVYIYIYIYIYISCMCTLMYNGVHWCLWCNIKNNVYKHVILNSAVDKNS